MSIKLANKLVQKVDKCGKRVVYHSDKGSFTDEKIWESGAYSARLNFNCLPRAGLGNLLITVTHISGKKVFEAIGDMFGARELTLNESTDWVKELL